MTIRLIAFTQYRENYGAHDWDGRSECPQYWKNKGGNEHLLGMWNGVTQFPSQDEIYALIDAARNAIDRRDDYSEEFIIDWQFFFDHEKTPNEELMEYGV